uniref:Ovule protein n=1 Tax=Ascaris lumbricoides TaxID=6252 RepID=A0A0M3HFY9_ASCLU
MTIVCTSYANRRITHHRSQIFLASRIHHPLILQTEICNRPITINTSDQFQWVLCRNRMRPHSPIHHLCIDLRTP